MSTLRLPAVPRVKNIPELDETKGHLIIQNKDAGDLHVAWDPDEQEEIDAAKAQFEDYTKEKKYTAFAVKTRGPNKGKPGAQITSFDPEAGGIIYMIPQMRGG